MLFWLLLLPTCTMCTWTAKCFLGNVASRAGPGSAPAAGHGTMEEQSCICWWGSLYPEQHWMAFPYLHHFQETHEPLQSKYFVGCEKLMFAILLLCLRLWVSFSRYGTWGNIMTVLEWKITASFLHPTSQPTLKSGRLRRKIKMKIKTKSKTKCFL